MKNVIFACLTGMLTALAVMMYAPAPTVAQSSFSGVIPFMTNSGRMAFFDQKTGKLYFYDSSVKKVLSVVQVNELGKETEVLESAQSSLNYQGETGLYR